VFFLQFLSGVWGKSNSSTRISTGIADFRSEYINLEWWNNFDDPQMKSYIVQAVNKNNDVRIATLKTEEFNQFVRTSFGEELPHFGILGIYTGYHLPRVFDLSGVPIPSTSNNFFATPLTMSYEAIYS
jgi:outer membrane protein TolC